MTRPSSNGLESLYSTWNIKKRQANLPSRIGMFGVEALALAVPMYIIPTMIQHFVHSVDEVYELLGRRARSPYKTVSWISVILATALLACWHVWLGRLSYKTMVEEESSLDFKHKGAMKGVGGAGTSWSRILGRIVVPLFLFAFTVQFAYHILYRYTYPAPLITANTMDGK